jgi:hypothetical protein
VVVAVGGARPAPGAAQHARFLEQALARAHRPGADPACWRALPALFVRSAALRRCSNRENN